MSTTPTSHTHTHTHRRRPSSQTRRPLSRPTTPLRPPSRSSLRASTSTSTAATSTLPLEHLDSQFAELSDGMADLEANFIYLGLMHESLARFSESFAAFLYGLNMNAFCVDFPEAPIPPSFTRPAATATARPQSLLSHLPSRGPAPSDPDPEATFLTTDTSFVENPPSSRTGNKFQTPTPASRIGRGGGGGIPRAGGRGRGSGIPARGSMVGRGRARGRGRGA
ncbi:hypothetical protein EJ05DRAFT_508107 [Pseudovirgaria hyperparasitica]|uniref:DASH complex subunit DAM1 n=1 Tax=Pseudovirgaria hyperparasitica TaxID=470096 RepID=A0A6A6WFS1_9PEZI|nr:uncharacterized protein EJ05DRAFT_508107 [Pseudovirgaria hyperparasitica]KAF2760870.1 hypothetical protein EJ05DRAFT_508107 [Pseudovirgaria hyperparasitica]